MLWRWESNTPSRSYWPYSRWLGSRRSPSERRWRSSLRRLKWWNKLDCKSTCEVSVAAAVVVLWQFGFKLNADNTCSSSTLKQVICLFVFQIGFWADLHCFHWSLTWQGKVVIDKLITVILPKLYYCGNSIILVWIRFCLICLAWCKLFPIL